MVTSAGYPPDTVANLKVNTFWDGIFHAGTYIFTALGLWICLSGFESLSPSQILVAGGQWFGRIWKSDHRPLLTGHFLWIGMKPKFGSDMPRPIRWA
jgi:hypothetical protein